MDKNFELVKVTTEEPDGGVHYFLEIMGKGTEVDGRVIDRMTLWFTADFKTEQYVIGSEVWEKIMRFYGKIKLDKNLQEKGWLIQQTLAVTGYNIEDNKPPSRFGFTFKYIPALQEELEKEALARREQNRKQQLANDVAEAIKKDDGVRAQIERLIKGLR